MHHAISMIARYMHRGEKIEKTHLYAQKYRLKEQNLKVPTKKLLIM